MVIFFKRIKYSIQQGYISFLFVLIFSIYLGFELGKFLYYLEYSKKVNILKNNDIYEIPTEIYDINKELITKIYVVKRDIVLYKDISRKVIRTLLLIEDENFYSHYGIDLSAILRAFVKNLISWKIVQGGSTLNQQLAKLTFTGSNRTIQRKLWDIWFSFLLEKRYSKREIIQKYLNIVYFGHGIYGIATASKYFFNKTLKDLDYVEIALLITILKAPNKYSPFKNSELSKKRQKFILYRLASKKYIEKEHLEIRFKEFWEKYNQKVVYFSDNGNYFFDQNINRAPYFSEYVRKILKTDLFNKHIERYMKSLKYKNDRIGLWNRKNETILSNSGLKIYTTLNLKKQSYAKSTLIKKLKIQDEIFWKNHYKQYLHIRKKYTRMIDFIGLTFLKQFQFELSQNRKKLFTVLKDYFLPLETIGFAFHSFEIKNFYLKYKDLFKKKDFLFNLIQGLIYGINPKTQHIEIMIGGRDFSKNQFNRVFSKRQPGSAFKIYVYGASFETELYHPETMMVDEPVSFYNSKKHIFWTPLNSSRSYLGEISLKNAFKYSTNTIAVKLTHNIGIRKVLSFFHKFVEEEDWHKKNKDNLSIALGTLEVSAYDLANTLAVVFNDGYKIYPKAILRIEDRNSRIIYEDEVHNKNKKERILSPKVLKNMKKILRAVMTEGTAYKSVLGINKYILGKTGTSQNNRDLWFIGGDENLVSSIWVGFDRGGVSLGSNQYGGNVSAKIWADMMKKIYLDRIF